MMVLLARVGFDEAEGRETFDEKFVGEGFEDLASDWSGISHSLKRVWPAEKRGVFHLQTKHGTKSPVLTL